MHSQIESELAFVRWGLCAFIWTKRHLPNGGCNVLGTCVCVCAVVWCELESRLDLAPWAKRWVLKQGVLVETARLQLFFAWHYYIMCGSSVGFGNNKKTLEHLQYFHTNPKSRRWLLNFHWNSRTSATPSHRQIYFHIHFDTPWQLHVLVLTHTWEWRLCAHSKLFQACGRVRVGRWTVDQDQGCQVNAGIFLYTTTPNAFKHQYAKHTFKTIVSVVNWHFEIDYSPQKRFAYVILEWHFHRALSLKYG